MNQLNPAPVIAILLMCSCVSPHASLTVNDAEQEALKDIRANRPKLYLAGARGTYEVGVPEIARVRLANLPRSRTLPSGCTDPLARESIAYARAYNEVIVRCLVG